NGPRTRTEEFRGPRQSPQPARPRALVVAANVFATRPLAICLEGGRFDVEVGPAGKGILAEIGRTRPHVIFLLLADRNGEMQVLCREIGQTVSAPVIACSMSHELSQIVDALQAGADDYFVLPMRTPELVARTRAVIRRVRRSRVADQEDPLLAGDVEVRRREHRAYRNGVVLELSPTEFRLLASLVRQSGRVVNHSRLLAQAWGVESLASGAMLRIYIRRLRAKLGDDTLIVSVRGIGYRFQPAVAVAADSSAA
ncbi:MAG: response regulator transcription factor, partial [bacterium]